MCVIELFAIGIVLVIFAAENLPFLVCMAGVAVLVLVMALLSQILELIAELPYLLIGCLGVIWLIPLNVAAVALVVTAFYIHQQKGPFEQFVLLMLLAIVMIVAQGWITYRSVKKDFENERK